MGDAIFVSAPFLGGTNRHPMSCMSYSPDTSPLHIAANHCGWMDHWTEKLAYKAGWAIKTFIDARGEVKR